MKRKGKNSPPGRKSFEFICQTELRKSFCHQVIIIISVVIIVVVRNQTKPLNTTPLHVWGQQDEAKDTTTRYFRVSCRVPCPSLEEICHLFTVGQTWIGGAAPGTWKETDAEGLFTRNVPGKRETPSSVCLCTRSQGRHDFWTSDFCSNERKHK